MNTTSSFLRPRRHRSRAAVRSFQNGMWIAILSQSQPGSTGTLTSSVLESRMANSKGSGHYHRQGILAGLSRR